MKTLENVTLEDCHNLIEIKGIHLSKLINLLFFYGYKIIVSNPSCSSCTKSDLLKNKEAIYNSYIELHFMI